MNVQVFQIPAGQEFRKEKGPVQGMLGSRSAQKWHLLCYKALVLLSEHREHFFDPRVPSSGHSVLPWSVLLHPCPLLPRPSWKSTVTPRNR